MSTTTSSLSASSGGSSPRCVPFPFRRGGARRGRLPPASKATGGCGRPLCRAAEVVGGGIQSAFFASLDGCSCVDVRTKSFNESQQAALLPRPNDDSADERSGGGAGRIRRSRASVSVVTGGGGKPRRGLGCCTPNTTY